MINLLDIKTPAQAQAAALKSDYGLDNHGLSNLGGVYWNLPTEALYEEIVFRREGTITRDGADRREHRQAHRRGRPTTSSSCASRRPRSTSGGASTTGPSRPDKFNELFSRLQGFLQGRDLFVPGLLRRRRPGLPDAGPHHHRARLAQPVRPQHVHPAADERGVPAARAGLHGDLLPGVQGHPADRRHGVEHVHRAELRPAAVHHRQHGLRRGDQEVDLHRDELPAAAAGRDPDALLGERRATTATSRSSSACRAPARRRCRPTRRAA